ncbi:PREDICTED: vam6/Vps39-like protein [Brassica oleracea var. oleracea]|uniref:CNH domain-containing protein n=1 Tax=Brassica oleracea var. oleracea TaxID=109376 RepID=A0A0D3DI06_BRAOL|nr:PREDICTED: vam6/Vps39-like protein [Brassica oleracea var. oleracea]
MVHNAYDSFQLLTNCPARIDAVESHNSKLFAGCYDGSLRIYSPQSPSSSSSDELRQDSYLLETTVTGFAKKPIVAMKVLASRELLLSLSESIAFHKLPNLETVAVITKAKGANAYSWDDRRGFLCFSRQKRVCVFKHDGGGGFVEVRDYGVPDTVKSISWCGENICLGIRKEYVILNTANGTLSEVFPSGRVAPPLVTFLPSGELVLGKDNIGVFVDQNGKLLQTERLCWSEAPTAIVIQNPYAIALLPRRVEVRLLRSPYPLIQTIVLQNIRHLVKSNNAVIVGLDNSVHSLFPVSIGAQIVQLTASGNFEEALALCKLLPSEESSLRAAKESSIHTRFAHYLFENGSYEEAMEHFLASQVDITHVLSMYPSITLPKTTMIPPPDKMLDISGEEASLSRGSSGFSDDMESSFLESEGNAALESKKMSHNTLMALIKYLQKKRPGIIEKATSEGTEEVISDAVGKSYGAYDSSKTKKSNKGRGTISLNSGAREMAAILDTALLQALLHTGQSGASVELLKGVNYCDVKICEEILMKSKSYSALLELFKSNSMHHEALKLLNQLSEESKSNQSQTDVKQIFSPELIIEYLKPLCKTDPMLVLEYSMLVLESCPTQTIDLFLSGNISADLVNSYLKQHAPNMQGRYLELMMAMNETAVSGNLQNEMVQIYLSEVLDLHAALSAQQKWDDKDHPPERKKLLSALENISGYNPQTLLKRLPRDALYEERAVILGKMNQHELALSIYVHKLHAPDLALAYCDRIYESVSFLPSGKPSSNIYLTLLQIYLNPKKSAKDFAKRIVALGSFESSDTTKMMESVLSSKVKGGRSKKIVAIEGAEDMLRAGLSSSTDSGRSDVDAEEPMEEGNSTVMISEVLDLLSQRWERINGAQALKLLPRETKLQNLLPFLAPLLRNSSEAHRNYSVIKSLRQSENLQVKEELYKHRKGVVQVTSDSMCSLCNKKIGASVFAVYPNGKTLVHFVCFKDSQGMKAVSKTSHGRRR